MDLLLHPELCCDFMKVRLVYVSIPILRLCTNKVTPDIRLVYRYD
jgi:hypothetical protein